MPLQNPNGKAIGLWAPRPAAEDGRSPAATTDALEPWGRRPERRWGSPGRSRLRGGGPHGHPSGWSLREVNGGDPATTGLPG